MIHTNKITAAEKTRSALEAEIQKLDTDDKLDAEKLRYGWIRDATTPRTLTEEERAKIATARVHRAATRRIKIVWLNRTRNVLEELKSVLKQQQEEESARRNQQDAEMQRQWDEEMQRQWDEAVKRRQARQETERQKQQKKSDEAAARWRREWHEFLAQQDRREKAWERAKEEAEEEARKQREQKLAKEKLDLERAAE
ncbi:uncharacterized protein K452DRAFT_172893 [Aplosporella prunicola CBS 121167]|uniref:Uncharacterized protein n=1 Tax=Aplosporella prunicola CBS 121167 TaxID=1176127 RepID=A0A6A6AWE6_9PEZI|nr:uncharacterized protein K452DRAFT_172893 [Aplosporella prunicola CBS 121167]KAF2135578.1 hypothetical protein K452DRAFT_172893 [Aplosporella prunicola CBS 121167]